MAHLLDTGGSEPAGTALAVGQVERAWIQEEKRRVRGWVAKERKEGSEKEEEKGRNINKETETKKPNIDQDGVKEKRITYVSSSSSTS